MQFAFFLGSNPPLSALEIWSVLVRHNIPFALDWADTSVFLVETQGNLPDTLIDDMGGVDRIAQVIGVRDVPWSAEDVASFIPNGEGKVFVGLSSIHYGKSFNGHVFGNELKQRVRTQHQRKLVFITPSQGAQLNAAQVEFNRLTRAQNAEFIFMLKDAKHFLLKTLAVQDIASYEIRDTSRPARDSKVGMLPPKLAQVMLNIARAHIGKTVNPRIFDPFCGMGTVLQEGWLSDVSLLGSDASERMIDYARENLAWMNDHFTLDQSYTPELFVHDVRQPYPRHLLGSIHAVVTEPYLGKPLRTPLSKESAHHRYTELAQMYIRMLEHVQPLFVPAGGVVMMLLPAYKVRGEHSPLLFPKTFIDAALSLGYSFEYLVPDVLKDLYKHTERGSVLYARPDAFVAREFILLKYYGS